MDIEGKVNEKLKPVLVLEGKNLKKRKTRNIWLLNFQNYMDSPVEFGSFEEYQKKYEVEPIGTVNSFAKNKNVEGGFNTALNEIKNQAYENGGKVVELIEAKGKFPKKEDDGEYSWFLVGEIYK